MSGRLAGKNVLIVGASRGIGLAIGETCHREGARVVLSARSVDKLDDAITRLGENAWAVACDVTDDASCIRAVGEAVEALGGLDALVYAAGIGAFGAVEAVPREDWVDVFQTNVFGAQAITREALPHLRESRGRCVFLNSESSLYQPTPWRGIAAYIASKRALTALVQSFQVEHPDIAFTDYNVGSTVTDFGEGGAFPFAGEWVDQRYVSIEHVLDPADHGHAVVALLSLPPGAVVHHASLNARRGALPPPRPL